MRAAAGSLGRLGLGLTATAAAGLVALALWRGTDAPGRGASEAPQAAAPVAPGAPAASPGAAATYAALESHLKLQPRDGRALVFKARMDAEAGRFERAAEGYATATRVAPRVARDPAVWVEFAEARAMAQGGRLAGEPEQSLERALALDDRHPQALDLLGSAAWERSQHAQAAALWRRLLTQTSPDSERHRALVRAIDRAEMLAKVSLRPPS